MSGRLADVFGYARTAATGGLVVMASLVLASFSTLYWHLLVTQGVLLGFGSSMSYFPSLSILYHWFNKRKGLATGIAVAGSGVGGFVLAPITRILISSYGFAWSLRISGIVAGSAVFICGSLFKTRLPIQVKGSFNYTMFVKDPRFICFFFSGVMGSFGYFVPFFFVPVYAVYNGLSTTQGALLVGILNAFSSLGRISLGAIADRFGHLESLCTCIFISSLSIFLVWPFANGSFGLLLFFVIGYGFAAGGFVSLIPSAIAFLFGTASISTVTGMTLTGVSLGNLFGPALAGWIVDIHTTTGPEGKIINFIPSMMLAGSALFAGATMTFLTLHFEKRRAHSVVILA
jgi:MFS family permease